MVLVRMRKKGFTLFEVLMTLSFLAVVLSLLYMTFHQSMAAIAQTEEQAEVIQRGRLILERMTGELKGSFMPAQQNPSKAFCYGLVGQSRNEGDDFMDRLDFTTMVGPQAGSPQTGGEILKVSYFLDHEPGGKGLTLFRRQDEAINGDLLRGGRSLAVCDRVRSLSFVFLNRQGERVKEWNSLEGAHRNELPSRVEIRLKLEDARSKVHVFRTQVYLPLAG
jgi:prepilin-type N-terminal cleavage/methylation domain-containing protein